MFPLIKKPTRKDVLKTICHNINSETDILWHQDKIEKVFEEHSWKIYYSIRFSYFDKENKLIEAKIIYLKASRKFVFNKIIHKL